MNIKYKKIFLMNKIEELTLINLRQKLKNKNNLSLIAIIAKLTLEKEKILKHRNSLNYLIYQTPKLYRTNNYKLKEIKEILNDVIISNNLPSEILDDEDIFQEL